MSTNLLLLAHHPPCLKPVLDRFPKKQISLSLRKQMQEIDTIGQKVFDDENRFEALYNSIDDFKQLVSFQLKELSMKDVVFAGSGLSEEKIKLLYAAATVMGIWMSLSTNQGYEEHRDCIFQHMFKIQICEIMPDMVATSSYFREQMRKDFFWEKNSDVFHTIFRLHMRRMSVDSSK